MLPLRQPGYGNALFPVSKLAGTPGPLGQGGYLYLGSLQDNFNTPPLNTALWSSYGDGATVNNSRVEMPMLSAYNAGFTSVGSGYRLLNSKFSWECGFANNDSSFNLALEIRDNGSASNCLIFSLEAFNVRAIKRVAGVNTDLLAGVTYNATTHRWCRIREQAGTVYWENSSDNSSWSVFFSVAMPSGLTMATTSVSFNAGAFTSQTGIAWVDNVNL